MQDNTCLWLQIDFAQNLIFTRKKELPIFLKSENLSHSNFAIFQITILSIFLFNILLVMRWVVAGKTSAVSVVSETFLIFEVMIADAPTIYICEQVRSRLHICCLNVLINFSFSFSLLLLCWFLNWYFYSEKRVEF